ncbi:MAG: hypothetical protein JXR36_17150, partial [Bacteroidales bacterium]|nr:hypothetical protein [Bacteroidales bacterium]
PTNINTYIYDEYGRILSETSSATGSNITYNYGISSLSVDKNRINSTYAYNDAGEVIEYFDPGGTIRYNYYASGLTKNIIYENNTTSLSYDLHRNKTSIIDPDAGTIQYTYDALGNLISQNDNGDIINMQYDILSRLITKSSTEGITNYYYDTQINGLGKIGSIVSPNGLIETFLYDNLGRNHQTTKTFEGKDYSYFYTFDNFSRVKTVEYPGGFKISKNYNNFGYLDKIYKFGETQPIWQLNTVNQFGQPTNISLGNGLTTQFNYDAQNFYLDNIIVSNDVFAEDYDFDPIKSNLNSRTNMLTNKTESFLYDDLDRLLTSNISNNNNTFQYFDNGNILNQTNIGQYQYTDNDHPHAVTFVDDNSNTISSNPQNISYNEYNRVTEIEEDVYRLTFDYDNRQQRIKTELFEDDDIIKTKYFFGAYEKEIDEHGNVKEINYISTPTGLSAVYITDTEDNSEKMYYVHQDYLGSIRAITNDVGEVEETHCFDAWGRQRNPIDWTYENIPEFNILDRGYTGHQHLDEFGLINMNARLYDPVLGRMLSPDNYIATAFSTQSLNRYTYANNNPLKYTDPSGDIISAIVIIGGFALAGSITGGIIANNNDVEWWEGAIVGGFIGAGVGSFLAAGVGASGVIANTGMAMSKGFGIASSSINSANINMGIAVIKGNEVWKASLVGAATGAWTTTGGVEIADKLGIAGKLGYQMFGTAGRSIGNNWCKTKNYLGNSLLELGSFNNYKTKQKKIK